MNLFTSLRYLIPGVRSLNEPLKAPQSSNKLRERWPRLRVPARRSRNKLLMCKYQVLVLVLEIESRFWSLKLTLANIHKWSVQLLDRHLLGSPSAYPGIQQPPQPALGSNLSTGCGTSSTPTISHQNYTHHTCTHIGSVNIISNSSTRQDAGMMAARFNALFELTSRWLVRSLELLVPSIQATI